MKKNNLLNVIDLSYYIIFYLRKSNCAVNALELQQILSSLQQESIDVYQKQLFKDNVEFGMFGPVIEKVAKEFNHYGSYPIESRKTLKRCERVFLMRCGLERERLAKLNKDIEELSIEPMHDLSRIEFPKVIVKRK